MCLGGGGGYNPPPVQKGPEAVEGGYAPPDMVNNQVINNANPRDQQKAARNEMDPPKKTKLKVQSDKNPGMM